MRLCPQHQYYFFLQDVAALRAIPEFCAEHVHAIHMNATGSLRRLLWQLPRLRRRYALDILHTQYVMPPWPARGNAVTIHDILFERYPRFFTRLFVLRSRLFIRWSARQADLLFTVSEYSRRELVRCYGIHAPRIEVLHNAVDHTRFHPGTEGESYVRQRGLESRGYLLTVGRIEPRKNHALLLRAYARMSGEVPPLVIVGQRDFSHGPFETALQALPAARQVIVLSDVPDEELPALYRHALAFVYPSLAEGFGMPPLEAMASGTPVLSSASTAIPEVVGDAGLLVDPNDETGLCAALERLCSDAALRERLIAAGLSRAAVFSWDRSAARLGSAYAGLMKAR